MALLVVLHRVDDYDTWRMAYEESAPLQQAGGVLEESVYRMTDDPNHVLVLHRFATADEAETFLRSPELQDGMSRAGVQADSLRAELFEEA